MSRICEEFKCLPSDIDNQDQGLLSRIMQLRAYANTREAMRTDKEKERDHKYATTESETAKLVAKVQYMIQHGLSPEDMEEDTP